MFVLEIPRNLVGMKEAEDTLHLPWIPIPNSTLGPSVRPFTPPESARVLIESILGLPVTTAALAIKNLE